ncbi:hypothetical protein [Fodinicurvata sp. EGI_FJ10296]|uniref:hypothetical protein n=1 Tax=Fodinicurvata sp. EGI_FJ10296 TaxID=3231908 RepID=UPI0034553559
MRDLGGLGDLADLGDLIAFGIIASSGAKADATMKPVTAFFIDLADLDCLRGRISRLPRRMAAVKLRVMGYP